MADVADVPPIREFLWPVLRVLARSDQPMARADYASAAADLMELSEAQRELRIPSGKHRKYRHRTGWAVNTLKHAGLVHSPGPGLWAATEEGGALVAAHPDGPSDELMAKLRRRARSAMQAARSDDNDDGEGDASAAEPDDDSSPEEQLESALESLHDRVAAELLATLGSVDPYKFEQIVLDVLHAMGYGQSREALQEVGGSGDGGIDGIISLDRLGLQKVYVQAKRWKGNIGRPEIQGFYGALSGRRANLGVFITTSRFTREAREFATSVSDTLVLVNGPELARLMVEYGVGVTQTLVRVPTNIDTDYFIDD